VKFTLYFLRSVVSSLCRIFSFYFDYLTIINDSTSLRLLAAQKDHVCAKDEAACLSHRTINNDAAEINSDGTVTPLIYLKGGGFGSSPYETTAEGFTVQKIEGYYMYLELDVNTGMLANSGLQCGKHDPNVDVGKSGNKLVKNLKGTVGKKPS
jgi:hypothetical protein